MQQLLKSHGLPLVLAGILFVMTLNSFDQVDRWFDRRMPAVHWIGVETITKTVKPGEVLHLEYTMIVNKQCPSDLRTFIIAPDGTAPVRFKVIAGGYTRPSPDPQRVRVAIAIPPASDPGLAPLQSGSHIYRASATRYCPEGTEDDGRIPDAVFQLEVP